MAESMVPPVEDEVSDTAIHCHYYIVQKIQEEDLGGSDPVTQLA